MRKTNFTRIGALFLVMIVLAASSVLSVFALGNVMEEDSFEEFNKFSENDPDAYILANKRSVSIEEKFNLDRVMVVLKHKYSKVNSIKKASDFSDSLFSEVKDLSYIDNHSTNDEGNFSRVNEDEFHQILSLKLKKPGKENVLKAIAYLNTLDEVLSAEPDYIYECEETYVPNDSYYNSQEMLEYINIEDAWDETRGSTSVKVGIFESGVSLHEDIPANRIVQGNLQYSSTEIHSHGTIVTGIIGATSNNSKGIAGIAQVKLVILDNYQFAESLAYAANNNIDIINASFYYIVSGTGEPASYNSTHAAAIQNYPGLLVCAAGNSGDNIDNKPYYPAAYSFDNVISVAGVDQYDNICVKDEWASNYGANNVHIAAPGDRVFTTFASGGYGYADGTSVAAPHVTGVAALLKSKYPGMDAKALKDYIESNVDVIPALSGKVKTGGRLNAYKALTNLKDFTVTYDANGGGGASMFSDTIIYGCATPLSKNTFGKSGCDFKGWHAQRTDTGKWYYTDGEWYLEGSQPAGCEKYIYRDEQKISRTTTDGKTVRMVAVWEKKTNISFVGNNATSGTVGTMTITSGHNY